MAVAQSLPAQVQSQATATRHGAAGRWGLDGPRPTLPSAATARAHPAGQRLGMRALCRAYGRSGLRTYVHAYVGGRLSNAAAKERARSGTLDARSLARMRLAATRHRPRMIASNVRGNSAGQQRERASARASSSHKEVRISGHAHGFGCCWWRRGRRWLVEWLQLHSVCEITASGVAAAAAPPEESRIVSPIGVPLEDRIGERGR